MVRMLKVVPKHDQQVTLYVEPTIYSDCVIVSRESLKQGGKIAIFDLSVQIPTDQSGIEVNIRPVDKGYWLSKGLYERHQALKAVLTQNVMYIHDIIGHTDNTNTSGEETGVIEMEMNPFKIFRREMVSAFNYPGIILVGGALYSTVSYWFSFPVYEQLGWFTLAALLDLLMALIPGVRKKTDAITAIMLNRFYQWGAALIVCGVTLNLQMAATVPLAEATGLGALIVKSLYGFAMGSVFFIYAIRTLNAFFKLMFGKRSSRVKEKIAVFFPEKFRKFITDDDFAS